MASALKMPIEKGPIHIAKQVLSTVRDPEGFLVDHISLIQHNFALNIHGSMSRDWGYLKQKKWRNRSRKRNGCRNDRRIKTLLSRGGKIVLSF